MTETPLPRFFSGVKKKKKSFLSHSFNGLSCLGCGEALYEIGVDDDGTAFGLSPQDLEKSISNLTRMAKNLNAEVSVLCERDGQEGKVCEMLVRSVYFSSSVRLARFGIGYH